MTGSRLSKLTCAVPAALGDAAMSALAELGVPSCLVQRGKELALTERSGPLGLGSRTALVELREEIIRFWLPPGDEAPVANRLVEALALRVPGRGSLWAEDATLEGGGPAGLPGPALRPTLARGGAKPLDYAALCCIVQRGLGDAVGRVVLEMGLGVPLVSFGRGMGLRNRLGLLRITIPVEKEVMYFAVPAADADLVADVAIRKARLDLPGRGFIYRFPIRAYAVNSRIRRGERRHVASIEQIIGALDELRGSAEWRRLAPGGARDGRVDRGRELACLSLVCDEGLVADFVGAAMDAGAGGATLVRLGYREPGKERDPGISHARETCDLIVDAGMAGPLAALMAERGLFEPGVNGLLEITRVERARTYSPG